MRVADGGGYGGTIVVDIGGVRRASGLLADDAHAFQELGARVRGHALPSMPDDVAGRVAAVLGEVGSALAALPPTLVDLAQELRVRAFWAEIADKLTAGYDLKGAELTEFKAAYASGLLTRYTEPWEAELAKTYANELHDREHPGGIAGFFHDVGDFFSGAWDAIKDPAVMIYHLTPFSGGDWTKQWADLAHGLAYGVTHPVEFGKALVNLDALQQRGFAYWLGNLTPAVAATLLSGGAAAGVRGAEGVAAVDRAAEGAAALDRTAAGAGAVEQTAAAAADASRAEKLAVLSAEAARYGIEKPFEGQDVYRIYGRTEDLLEPRSGSLPFGESWTPVDPASMTNPRAELGLPDYNKGRFVIHGELEDPTAIKEIRPALAMDGNPGGGPEYVIEDPAHAIKVLEVKGVNPDY
jgi:hypothetical protein